MPKHAKTIGLLITQGVFGYFIAIFLDEIKLFLMNIGINESINFDVLKVILFIIGIAGVSIISYILLSQLHRYKRKERKLDPITNNNIKTEYSSTKQKIPYRKSTPDSKLSDLIDEIELFINKWYIETFLNPNYRKKIIKRWLKSDRKMINKIKEHPREISRKIIPLKKLNIMEAESTLNLLNEIVDRMTKLGIEVESIFQTVKSYPEQEKVNKIISDGDSICEDLRIVKEQLEKLRKNLI